MKHSTLEMKESNLVGKGGSFSQVAKSNHILILLRTKKSLAKNSGHVSYQSFQPNNQFLLSSQILQDRKNACAHCSKLYSKILFSMDFLFFFLNLWFQSFLLNHLTLCLMTSFLCPSPLMSREHLRKMITTEKMQRFRKRQAEHLHSEVYLRQSHG